jgi:hypothetical protein
VGAALSEDTLLSRALSIWWLPSDQDETLASGCWLHRDYVRASFARPPFGSSVREKASVRCVDLLTHIFLMTQKNQPQRRRA